MKNKILLLGAAVLQIFTAFAQNKILTVEDAVLKQRTTLAPERLSQLMWIPGTHLFTYVAKRNGKECLVRQNADDLQRDTILGIEDIKSWLEAIGSEKRMPERFPFFTWMNKDEFRFFYNNGWYLLNLQKRNIALLNKIPENGEEPQFEPLNNHVAFIQFNNVLVYNQQAWEKVKSLKSTVDVGDGSYKEFAITGDGSTFAVVNGKAVHRNEFGINKGIFWSATANRVAYYKCYEGLVTNYPLLKLSNDTNNNTPGFTEQIRYPMAGNSSHSAKVYIYDINKRINVMVETGTPDDQYLTNVTWSPDDEYLYIAVVNRDQNEMKLNRYDGKTGKFIKTLFTETHAKYVEPEHGLFFHDKTGKQFIWFSERDGYNHLYLMDHNGKVIRQLSKGKADVTELVGFNAKGTIAYYMQATEDGLERQLYSVELATGKVFQITRNKGVHTCSISSDGLYILDTYSNINTPRRTTLMKSDGAELSILHQSKNPLFDYKACGIRLFSIKADDGTLLNCRMFYPTDFDSTKKYPVLVYVYGGPHAQMITNSWMGGGDYWLYYMAQQGYVVFTLDNRGSSFRGMAFEQATFRSLGNIERADQLAGVNFLKQQSYVDAARIGVFGWSFGGFMATGLMSRSNAYKVGVAGGPVIDWRLYEIMYTERYMDTPKQNPEGYEDADLTNYVKNIKGKLLLIHGTDDDVVVWQHSLTYLKKCVDEGVQVDYFVYPGHKHNVLGKDRVHLMQKITDYFKLHL
ncbi:MAG: DPP IV N-terminal domain-containing protein [Bacteroidota bacterium]|jgi:dipeptidyl-peptidase-4|nr:S9 family peptidase [Sphingobacteriales bacterium]